MREKWIFPMDKIANIFSRLRLTRSEWVCLLFIIFALFRVLTSSYPLEWQTIKWSTFPRIDIFVIAVSVWVLKLSRKNRIFGVLILLLLVSWFYGHTGNSDDPFIPVRKYLGPAIMEMLNSLRFILLAIIVSSLGFMIYKNTIFIREATAKTRIILPFFFIVFLYPFVPLIINTGHSSGVHDQDLILEKIDSWMFLGQNPLLVLESWIKPALSEWMAFAYSSYGPFFAIVFGSLYLKDENQPAEELIFMSTLALAIGYASYTIIPAKGPMFTQHFSIPLDLYYMKEFKNLYMDQPRIDRDCFPSLHTALTLIFLYSSWKNIRPLFWILLPIAIFIPIACVYLRYHYVVDVFAGILLAVLVWKINELILKKGV